MPFCITVTRQATADQVLQAKELAHRYDQPYIARAESALPDLYEAAMQRIPADRTVSGILVVGQQDFVFWLPNGDTLQYHPGMAVHRIKVLAAGGSDPMVEAMQLRHGDRVVDCTAGLCSDALVMAHVVGDAGAVHCCEASLPIALVVGHGLTRYSTARKHIQPAMKRLEVHPGQAIHFLRKQADHSWDVVYFDPMFDDPVQESAGIAPLRHVADPSPLSEQLLAEAARVAGRAVVIKDRRHGRWLKDPRFDRIVGKSSRRLGYAVMVTCREVDSECASKNPLLSL